MKCLHGEPVLNRQRKKDPSGSAIKTLAATSFARRTKATYTKKPQPHGNLQNSHILAAKNTVNSRKCA